MHIAHKLVILQGYRSGIESFRGALCTMVAPTVDHPLPTHGDPPSNLRICSLLPSATETVGRLGLADSLVCVTHCCDIAPDPATLDRILDSGAAVRATSSWVKPDSLSQGDIDEMVKVCCCNCRGLRVNSKNWCG